MSNTAELATKNESALSQQTDDQTRRRITPAASLATGSVFTITDARTKH